MNVLGIHYGSSDAGVCAIIPGRKPVAVALERIDRIKYSGEVTPGWTGTYERNLRTLLHYCATGLGMAPEELTFDVVVHTRSAADDTLFRSLLAPHTTSRTQFFQLNHHLT